MVLITRVVRCADRLRDGIRIVQMLKGSALLVKEVVWPGCGACDCRLVDVVEIHMVRVVGGFKLN